MGKPAQAALALAEAFFKAVPADKKKRASEAEWAAALQRFHREAAAIRQRFGLGFLGRAMAIFQFQKRLLIAGIDPDIVRKVVFALLLNVFTAQS